MVLARADRGGDSTRSGDDVTWFVVQAVILIVWTLLNWLMTGGTTKK